MNHQIELLYFNACPSWEKGLVNLRESLKILNINDEIKMIVVETPEEAIQHKFTGSPMFRLDGVELFPTNQENYALGCRMYPTPEGYKGWPTIEMLVEEMTTVLVK